MTAYAFRPMSADLPTMQRWLGTPDVSQWWHDPSEQLDRGHGSALIRAYEKAGFCRDRIVDTPDGAALLMLRDP
jgi:hypothetical protein